MTSFFGKSEIKRLSWRAVSRAAALYLMSCCAAFASSAHARELVIGRVSTEPQRAIARMERLAQYLTQRTADLGITKGRTIAVPTDAEMDRLLRAGQVDLFSETVVAAAAFVDKGNAEVLLHEWRDQMPYYRSLFVVRKGSEIRTLAELKSRKMALDNVASTTAYLLPMAILRNAGLDPVQIPTFNDAAPAGKVGYVFSGRVINSASWTARGVVDAGAVSDVDMNKEIEIPEGIRKELQILVTSPPLPRSLMLTRKNLDADLKKRIIETLIAADGGSAGKAMLRDYFDVSRYAPFQGEVVERFRDVRRLLGRTNP